MNDYTPMTPSQVEQQLVRMAHETDAAHTELKAAEVEYEAAKAAFDLGIARARVTIGHSEIRTTVQERDDLALIDCEAQRLRLATAEALVKIARANARRVSTQVDIARSVGTTLRAAMSA